MNNSLITQPDLTPPTKEVMGLITDQAGMFFRSGMCPAKFKNAEQVAVVALYGRELGLTMMRALKEIHVVNGIPGISANLMLTLIRERMPLAVIDIVKSDGSGCTIKCKRADSETVHEVSYTMAEATLAGLNTKDTYRKHPTDMLFARCVSRVGKWYFSDVLNGYVHTPDELQEIKAEGSTETGLQEARSGEGRMPKAQVVTADPASGKDETAVVVTETETGKVVDVQIMEAETPSEVLDLEVELSEAGDIDAIERLYDKWRAANVGKSAVLLAGYSVYVQAMDKKKHLA